MVKQKTYTMSRWINGANQVIGKGIDFCSVGHVASVKHMFQTKTGASGIDTMLVVQKRVGGAYGERLEGDASEPQGGEDGDFGKSWGRRHAGHAPGALACGFGHCCSKRRRPNSCNHGTTPGNPPDGDWHHGCLLLSLCPDLPSAVKPVARRQGCRQVQRHAQGSQP